MGVTRRRRAPGVVFSTGMVAMAKTIALQRHRSSNRAVRWCPGRPYTHAPDRDERRSLSQKPTLRPRKSEAGRIFRHVRSPEAEHHLFSRAPVTATRSRGAPRPWIGKQDSLCSPMPVLPIILASPCVRFLVVPSGVNRGVWTMVLMIESVRSRPRACLVCGSELPAAEEWTAWMCHECLVLTDADAMRARPLDFTTRAGREASRGTDTPTNFSPSAA